MQRAISTRTIAAVCTLTLGLSSGCVAKDCQTEEGRDAVCLETPTRYDGDQYDETLAPLSYSPGTPLEIDGVYGNIEVVVGEPGQVSATFMPFAWGASGEQAEASRKMQNESIRELGLEDAGTILVRSERMDDDLPLVGMDLQIALPPEFDGALTVTNRSDGNWNPGNVDIDFVGLSPEVVVRAGALSDCEITGGLGVTYTYVKCADRIQVLDVSDQVEIESTGAFGDVTLALASIAPTTPQSTVRAGGDILVTFPANTSFSAQAQSTAPDIVDQGSLPASCVLASAADTAKSVTCGDGGPLYGLTSTGGGVTLTIP